MADALKGWLNKAQCAAFLGVSPITLDRYCGGGRKHDQPRLPSVKLGGKSYFDPDQVRAWVLQRGGNPPQENWSTL